MQTGKGSDTMVRYALALAFLLVSCSRPRATPRPQIDTAPDPEETSAAAKQMGAADTTPPADARGPSPKKSLSQEELRQLAEEAKEAALRMKDLPALHWFNRTADQLDRKMLLRAQWYTGPYPRHYRILQLRSDGSGSTWREVPNWASQGSSHGRLSDDQLADIRARIKALDLKPTPPATPEDGQLHLAFTFRTDDGVIRHDFVGTVPRDVQAIIDLISDEIKAQYRTKVMERIREARERREKKVLPTR